MAIGFSCGCLCSPCDGSCDPRYCGCAQFKLHMHDPIPEGRDYGATVEVHIKTDKPIGWIPGKALGERIDKLAAMVLRKEKE